MLTRQHALKSSAEKVSIYTSKNEVNMSKVKSVKVNSTPSKSAERSGKKQDETDRIDEIYAMLKTVMAKLDTLDDIQKRIVCVEREFKEMKTSLEFAHAEVKDLKDEVQKSKKSENEMRYKIKYLEESNDRLQESVIDLKARSMRDNLLFYNVEEEEKENTDEKIYQILEEKLEIRDARSRIKIDRSHRVGRKRNTQRKPRAIVVKFNYFKDREHVRLNARKLRGTRIGIAEQFPEEIEKIRQKLYPEMKKAKAAGHRVRMVRDKLYIDNVEFKPHTSD
jgi:tRNA threonylcarbamoyladenosine modification (KEOPS) complex  Pcc1 subunit